MPKFPEPVTVSPLIKLFRYAFLFTGVIYGAAKLKTLRMIEEGRKEEREQRKRDKEAKLAEEKQAASERDIAAIVAIFKGNPEVETNVADSPQTDSIKAEEVKQVVNEEKEDETKYYTLGEVKKIIREQEQLASSPSSSSPSTITEFRYTDEDKTNILVPEESFKDITNDTNQRDMFSSVFNLTRPTYRNDDNLTSKIKSRISGIHSDDSESKTDMMEEKDKEREQDGYFVETFSENFSFAESAKDQNNFGVKTDK